MDDIEKIKKQIKKAREHARRVFRGRSIMAGALTGNFGVSDYEIEFPEPDVMHVYTTMFGRRMGGEPTVYRLSFGRPVKWVGVSHVSGFKPSDIVIMEDGDGS